MTLEVQATIGINITIAPSIVKEVKQQSKTLTISHTPWFYLPCFLTFVGGGVYQIEENMHMDKEKSQQLYHILGLRIRQHRERLKLSQGALADQLSISRNSVVNVEKGQQHTPLHVLFEIAYALGLEIEALLPSISEIFSPDSGMGISRMAHIEKKTAGSPESKERLVQFLKSVISEKGDVNDDTRRD